MNTSIVIYVHITQSVDLVRYKTLRRSNNILQCIPTVHGFFASLVAFSDNVLLEWGLEIHWLDHFPQQNAEKYKNIDSICCLALGDSGILVECLTSDSA